MSNRQCSPNNFQHQSAVEKILKFSTALFLLQLLKFCLPHLYP
ncbi:hypothetical protein HMPREF9996_00774 [Aggregatibacter actinomycetemcomitans Y4]|nr:hypothetical protein CF65_00824 [Aggregatibacter actinomycetemcomitans HK1651]EKX97757.1 hypothetical protein HMPREF9996_00774 [Aggregatibacter actinomycetemcomitans Y4]